jgi:hypothetical protein
MRPDSPVFPALLQAALLGGSPSELLRGAAEMRGQSGAGGPAARNLGLQLGAFLGAVVANGVRRIGLVADPPLTAMASWLAAETSARGVGSRLSILPAVPVEMALGDAAMIYLRTSGGLDGAAGEWQEKGAAVLVLQAGSGLAGIGAEAVRWEIGAAIAAHLLEIKPFPDDPSPSQPAKLVKTLQRKRKLGFRKPAWQLPGLAVWSTASRLTLDPKAGVTPVAEAILGRLRPGQTLFLGLYFARGSLTDHYLGRIAVVVGEGQSVDCLTWHGRMPRQVRRPGASLSLLLAVEPGTGPELPELRISAGALQLIQAVSDFGRLEESGDEAYLIQFKSKDSAAEFLHIMEVAAQQ